MHAAEQLLPSQSGRLSNSPRPLDAIRSQAAFVRTLLDEVERLIPAGEERVLSEQIIEELTRLGCRCVELASHSSRRE